MKTTLHALLLASLILCVGATAATAQCSILKNIAASNSDATPLNLTSVNGPVYFSVNAPWPDPTKEVWKTDGTDGGTMLVKAIPYPTLTQFVNMNGKLIFHADDQGVTTDAVYVSDGTDAGTFKLKEFKYRYLRKIVVAGQYAYFSAKFGTDSSQLWRTDGTVAGTIALTSSTVGTVNTNDMVAMNGLLYFKTNSEPTFDAKNELWKTDGTVAGTSQIGTHTSATSLFYIDNMCAVIGTLYFKGNEFVGTTPNGLWKCDGTAAGTIKVKSIDPRSLSDFNGTAYFAANGNSQGVQLWKTDGTDAGTVMVKTLNAGFANYDLNRFTVAGSKAYFLLYYTGNSKVLYSTDGTDAGTNFLGEVGTSGVGIMSIPMLPVGDALYFGGSGSGFANFSKTMGTAASTASICRYQMNGPTDNLITQLAVIGQTLIFNPYVNETGQLYGKELWKSTDITIAVKQPTLTERISLSPNPAQSTLTISGLERIDAVEVINASGIIQKASLRGDALDISGLKPGLYFLRVHAHQEVATQSFVKE